MGTSGTAHVTAFDVADLSVAVWDPTMRVPTSVAYVSSVGTTADVPVPTGSYVELRTHGLLSAVRGAPGPVEGRWTMTVS